VLPAGTVTVAGTVTPASLLDNATDVGPLEEAAVNVTVPIDDCSAVTLVGASDTDVGVTPSPALVDNVTVEFAAMTTLS
jgi:hypothetical protein